MNVDLGRVRKCVVAGAGALSASLATGAADGDLSRLDWVLAAAAAVSVGWATWRVPNRVEPPAAPSDEPAGDVVDEHVSSVEGA